MTERCTVCARAFLPQFAYQVVQGREGRRYFCGLECRRGALSQPGFASTRRARRLAILNQKGGTGKTTTAVNLAAGIADRGYDVLLVDMDAQGNVGTSLGVRGDLSLYHLMVDAPIEVTAADGTRSTRTTRAEDVVVPVRGKLDVITADATLAQAEVHLARLDAGRDRVLADRLSSLRRYQYIVLDCGPSLNLMNQNALTYADEVLIPVSCDYLALVGVKQVLRTLKDIDKHLGHAVRISGVVPTFFDARTKLSREAVDTLSGHFKDRLCEPIRRSTRLAEAPSRRQTIFEYAPESAGADDYRRLVDRYIGNASQAAAPQAVAS